MPRRKQNQVKIMVAAPKKKAAKKNKEMTRLGAALRGLGGLGGGALGGLFGQGAAGAGVGKDLGAALSRWLGSGDYQVSANSIISYSLKGTESIPAMHRDGQTVVVRHKEFLTEVTGSTTFTVRNSLEINPGNSYTFPWLSGVAARFQEYRIRGMVFHYIPTSGNAVSSTNAALGSVMLQTSYRSSDTAPVSKVEMLNEYWSSEAMPSEAFCHPIECDPKENPFNVQYIRTGAVPTGDSKLLYDLGVTHLAVSGQQASNIVLGDLWVTYEVELKKPIVSSNVNYTSKFAAFYFTGTMSGSDWFNGTQSIVQGNLDVTGTGRTLTFPKGTIGTYCVVVRLKADTTFSVADLSGTVTPTNCTNVSNISNAEAYFRNVLGGSSPTLNTAMYICGVKIVNPSLTATIAFPSSSLTGNCSQTDVIITPAGFA